MKNLILILFAVLFFNYSYAQLYEDYIGAGHYENLIITSSSDYNNATAVRTLDGSGFVVERYKASRFLSQTTLGYDTSDINKVLALGYESWIDEQMDSTVIPISKVLPLMYSIWDEIYEAKIAYGIDPEDINSPSGLHFNYAWWQILMDNDDKLRQKVANALSQILVVSNDSNIGGYGWGVSNYYDRFLKHAFGNYLDVLTGVSLDPNMGVYLSHLNNPKTNEASNIHPDENFAREIMQLFSIGLYKLNMDGTRQQDANGDDIPTYDNNDIKGMAKVFTGLGAGDVEDYVEWTDTPYFGLGYWGTNKIVPMQMYDAHHEPGDKMIFDGHIVPDTMGDFEEVVYAIELLFDHPNVPPFISRRLIQNLVKSNPSPEYIERIADIFVDNGEGERGDLGAVVKAILLDDEARLEEFMHLSNDGKLRSPIVRYTNFVKAIPNDSPSGRYWNNGYSYQDDIGQYPMSAPSVFNFFLPDYQPNGDIYDNDLFGPEYQVHNTKTILNFYDWVYSWTVWDSPVYSWENSDIIDTEVNLNTVDLETLSDQPEVLMNTLDMMFTYGTLTDRTKDFIKTAVEAINETNTSQSQIRFRRIRLALYLMMVSPDYAIMK